MLSQLATADPVVHRFERWARENLPDFSMAAAAAAVGAGERTLQRRVSRVLGKTPIGFVRELRVERAIHLLRTTDDSLDEVAVQVGYEESVTLRTLLRKKTGQTVRQLRAS